MADTLKGVDWSQRHRRECRCCALGGIPLAYYPGRMKYCAFVAALACMGFGGAAVFQSPERPSKATAPSSKTDRWFTKLADAQSAAEATDRPLLLVFR